jgi:predicted ATPase
VKIKFSNLGSIKETELDLRPLTVIIGPNNSNKTYVAYCVYGLWTNAVSMVTGDLIRDLTFKRESINTISIKINKLIKLFITEHNRKKVFFQENLEKFFQDYNELFSRTDFEIPLTEKQVQQALDSVIQKKFLRSPSEKSLEITLKNDNSLFISNLEKISRLKRNDNREEEEAKVISLILALNEQLFSIPFLLPAERNAFIITYRMLANRRYNLLKENRRKLLLNHNNTSDISYPEPIENFLDFLTNVELKKSLQINPATKNEFQKLADEIEHYILDKNKVFYEPTVLEGKEIKVKVNENLIIDLYNASSSVKQLTPLLLYLRYRAEENDLLIIDEPEMNLHPESQAKLLEVFGILVNLGVKVLITTHSPYFMEYLNSLVIGNINHPQSLKKQAKELYLKDSRAFVSLDKVSVYEMRDNQLHSLKDEEYGIRWDTLSDVSHVLVQKYFLIDEQGKDISYGKTKKSA